jgi:methylmalonyl-CoA/ethylmalonyl-CoA epimerase
MTFDSDGNLNAISGILGIDHVGIAVHSLADGIDFYQRTFGCSVISREINLEQGIEEAILKMGDAQIQLLAPISEQSPITRFLQKRGEGIQQVALRVIDIQKSCDEARDLGITVLYNEPKLGSSGSLINFLHPSDCKGVLIELVQNVSRKSKSI